MDATAAEYFPLDDIFASLRLIGQSAEGAYYFAEDAPRYYLVLKSSSGPRKPNHKQIPAAEEEQVSIWSFASKRACKQACLQRGWGTLPDA